MYYLIDILYHIFKYPSMFRGVNMSKFNYFKVSDLLLDTDIKKSELWVYLTHCRHRGEKSKGYSIAGINAVQGHFGKSIKEKTYIQCINSLKDKGLINEVDTKENKIFTGFFKIDKAIEIIKGKTNIQIPIDLLDKKIITNLSIEEIKDVIRLYSLYDPLGSYGGLDYNYINAVNKDTSNGAKHIRDEENKFITFGSGYNRVIHKKRAYKIEYPTEYISDLKIDINKYMNMRLFKLKPVILEYDIDDEDLTELKGEVFQDLVKFRKELRSKYITVLKDNQKVIWVLEPVYPVKNPKYEEYLKHRAIARERAIDIYSNTDEATNKETLRKLIYGYDLIYFIDEQLGDRKDIEVDTILELLNYLHDEDLTIDSIEWDLEPRLNLITSEISKEKQCIEDDNIRISKEENRRRRHTTSPRLSELKNNYHNLQRDINKIIDIENKLIDLIPKWVIDKVLLEY